MSYDDWKTDPEYGLSHRDLREAELRTELEQAVKENTRLDELLQEAIEMHRGKTEENAALQGRVDNMTSLLEEILEWARDNQDVVDGDDGQPQPDAIMKMANEIEETLGRGESAQSGYVRDEDDPAWRRDMISAGRGHLLK